MFSILYINKNRNKTKNFVWKKILIIIKKALEIENNIVTIPIDFKPQHINYCQFMKHGKNKIESNSESWIVLLFPPNRKSPCSCQTVQTVLPNAPTPKETVNTLELFLIRQKQNTLVLMLARRTILIVLFTQRNSVPPFRFRSKKSRYRSSIFMPLLFSFHVSVTL